MTTNFDMPNNIDKNVLSLETKTLLFLFEEKGANIEEIAKYLNVKYTKAKEVIASLIENNYIYERCFDPAIGNLFFMTPTGVINLYSVVNYPCYCELYFYLYNRFFNKEGIHNYLKKVFYEYYISGEVRINDLENEYFAYSNGNQRVKK